MSAPSIDLNALRWADWAVDPYPLYRVLRDEAPVFFDRSTDCYLVSRYKDVSSVLTDPARFSNVPAALLDIDPEDRISTLRNADAPRHTWLRQILTPLFNPKAMRLREAAYDAVSRQLLDAADRMEVVDVSAELGVRLPVRVTCDLLGVPLDQQELFLALTLERLKALSAQGGGGQPAPDGTPFADVRAQLWEIVRPIVEARRARPEDDLITLLSQTQARLGQDTLSDNLFIDMLLHLLTGGFHTTKHLIELLLSHLADRPDLWARLREDRALAAPAIEEMLRWDSPVQAMPRRAAQACTVAGVEIPQNATVMVVYASANRDERMFADPDSYLLDRSPNRHVTFGVGPHFCPGSPVTRFEVRSLLNAMLERYRAIERAGPSVPLAGTRVSATSMRGYESVPLRLIAA